MNYVIRMTKDEAEVLAFLLKSHKLNASTYVNKHLRNVQRKTEYALAYGDEMP